MKTFLREIKKMALLTAVLLGVAVTAWSQTAVQNFGTETASLTSNGATTPIPFPSPTNGTAYVRVSNVANSGIFVQPTSNPLGTDGSYIRAIASTTSAVAKISPVVGYTGGKEFYTSFKMLLGDASATATADSGYWAFYQGTGAMYENNNDLTGAQVFAGLRFTCTAGGVVKLENRAGSSWNTTGLITTSFSQGVVYAVELVGNNKASDAINYMYKGISQSVAVNKFDLYINGELVGDDLGKGQQPADSTVMSVTFIGSLATKTTRANIFIDDVIIYNAVPAAIGVASTDPSVRMSSAFLAFGEVKDDAEDKQTFTLTPTALTGDLTLGMKHGDRYFSVDSTSIAQSTTEARTITVTFAPRALGDLKDTLLISGGGIKDTIVALSGIGISASTPELSVTSAKTVYFDDVELTTNAIQTVKLHVNAIALEEINLNLVDTTSPPIFTNAALNPADSTVEVTFAPTAVGSYGATLYVAHNDLKDSVKLSGRGDTAYLRVDSALIRMGSVAKGESKTVRSRISAKFLRGNISFTISGANADMFSVDSATFVKPIGGYLNKQLSVSYAPTAMGSHSATLTVASEDMPTLEIPLSGEGTASAVVAWNFNGIGNSNNVGTGQTYAATTYSTGLDTAASNKDVTRGEGVAWSTGANSFRSTGFGNVLPIVTEGNTKYFQVVVKPASRKMVSLSTISGNANGTANYANEPGVSTQFAYSLDGENFTLIGTPQVKSGGNQAFSFDVSGIGALQNTEGTIYLRYYASGQTTTGGWGFTSSSVTAANNGLTIYGIIADAVCNIPQNLEASNITTVAANLSWTGSAAQYELAYATSGSANFSSELVNVTNKDISGLTAEQEYIYKVRSICGEGDTSDWSVVDTFTTVAPDAKQLVVLHPANNAAFTVGEVGFKFHTENFVIGTDGKIKLEVNGATQYLTNDTVTISSLVSGAYIATISLVDMSENPLSPVVSTTRSFTVDLPNCEPAVATPVAGKYYAAQSVSLSSATDGAKIEYKLRNAANAWATYTAAFAVSATDTLDMRTSKAGMDTTTTSGRVYEIILPTEVANIAEFKASASATNTTPVKIMGDVTFVWRNGRNIYVKDNTGGMLIYDNSTPVITKTYNSGDVISGGIMGTLTLYGGQVKEFIPLQDFAAGTAGEPVQPVALTMQELLADFASYESQLVTLTDTVKFTASKAFSTGASGNIGITQGTDNMLCRNNYGTLTGYTVSADKHYIITGFVVPYNTDKQIAPRDTADIKEIVVGDEPPLSVDRQLMEQVTLYPNPVAATLSVEAPLAVAKVEVINGMGAVLLQVQKQAQVNVSALPAGSYFVRITFEGGKQVVKQVYKR